MNDLEARAGALLKALRELEAEFARLLTEHHLVSVEEIKQRCFWRLAHGGPDVLHIDGVAVLELHPPEFSQEAIEDRYIVTVTQKFRRQ